MPFVVLPHKIEWIGKNLISSPPWDCYFARIMPIWIWLGYSSSIVYEVKLKISHLENRTVAI